MATETQGLDDVRENIKVARALAEIARRRQRAEANGWDAATVTLELDDALALARLAKRGYNAKEVTP